MRKTILAVCTILLVPAAASAQWEFAGAFPDDTTFTTSMHGVAVDPDGKVWLQPFSPTDTVFTDTDTLAYNALYVYNSDGTEVEFSPIRFITVEGVQDTLFSGRGLGTDADGNILVASFDELYKVDYQTGEGLASVVPQEEASLSAPRADENGNIFTAHVVQDTGPLRIYDSDLNFVENAIDTTRGFSRSFAVSADGNAIYWGGYTNRAIVKYTREDEFSPFGTEPDSLLPGIVSESMARNPATGNIWASNALAAGGFAPTGAFNDSVNTGIEYLTWYEIDVETDTIVDSLTWNKDAGFTEEKPRGIAFSPDGMTAYAVVFDATSGAPSVQMFTGGGPVAIERDDTAELPTHFDLAQNYPNPFNPSTTIGFSLTEPGHAELTVYDALGRKVDVLVNETLQAGRYDATFDAQDLPSGTYLYVLEMGGQRISKTMLLLK